MLRIAFCDDETEILEELESLTEQYCADRGCRMEYQAFHSPLELLAAMEKGAYFDAVFLDVLMPGENGISTARELRQTDQNIKIIFLTTSSEYAVDSYSVGAYFYQMKPLRKEIYSGLLDSLRAACEKEQKKSLVVRTRNGITQISFDDLQYCEVRGRNLLYYLGNETVLEGNGRMDRLEEQLAEYGNFIRVHRSFLVNMESICNISYRSVVMKNGTEIPVPHGKFTEIRNRYLAYAFERKKVIL